LRKVQILKVESLMLKKRERECEMEQGEGDTRERL
jgi:hypothetical protein